MGTDPNALAVSSSWDLWLALAIAAAAVGLLAFALWRRWFSSLVGGFATALTFALVGAGVITAMLLGTWSYHAAREAVFAEQLEGLDNVGRVAEGELLSDVRLNVKKLENVATEGLLQSATARPAMARQDLADLQRYNPCLLQLSIYDDEGRPLLVSTGAGEATETPNRIGAAYALEGKPYISDPYWSPVFKRYVLYISVPISGATGKPMGALGLRYDLQEKLQELFASTRFGASGYAVLLDHDGKVLAHHDRARIGDDLSSYPAYRAASAGTSDWVVATNRKGVRRLFTYRPLKSPATLGGRELILLTEMDAAEALAPILRLRNVLVVAAAVLCAAWALLARLLARHLTQPLTALVGLCAKVGAGDLSAQATVAGRDELNRFADVFNQMVAGLRERDRVKQIFGRYVTTQVSERVLKHGVKLGGERKQLTILFSDIRGFTTMAEGMQPEQVVELLNEYFSEMVEAVVECGGVLDKFIGDGMLAVFGSLDEDKDHRKSAVTAGLRMKAKLAKINGEREMRGQPAIHIGIGIHTDEVVVGHIGSRDRVEHTVIGDGVNTCSRVESMNKELGTTLLITEQTHGPIADSFECRAMPETKVKGKAKALRVYEVLSAKAPGAANSASTPAALSAKPQAESTIPPSAAA